MLKMKQFPDKWCDMVMHTTIGGQVGIKVNDRIGPYFKTHKWLRQGDDMSPLLFHIAADALAIRPTPPRDPILSGPVRLG